MLHYPFNILLDWFDDNLFGTSLCSQKDWLTILLSCDVFYRFWYQNYAGLLEQCWKYLLKKKFAKSFPHPKITVMLSLKI